jgi:peroxiredoxin
MVQAPASDEMQAIRGDATLRMRMNKKLTSIVLGLVLATCALAQPTAPVRRKSPEFIISQPSGKSILLSSLKGKVVVMEFLFVKSQHCVRVAVTLNKLQSELGSRGFQPVGIVFDAPDPTKTGGDLLASMIESFNLTYPVGYASSQAVDAYLGRSGNEMLAIPQLVVIDRAGVIRAITGGKTDPQLEDEAYLRTMIDGLLKESPSPVAPAKHTSPQKSQKNP